MVLGHEKLDVYRLAIDYVAEDSVTYEGTKNDFDPDSDSDSDPSKQALR